MAREFCDAIRLADHPEDEDAMVGILQQHMEVVPQQPGPKKQPPKPKPKPQNTSSNQQSRGQCWFYKSGNCNRGAQCPFDHGTEADKSESGGARGMEDPATAQAVCGAAVV